MSPQFMVGYLHQFFAVTYAHVAVRERTRWDERLTDKLRHRVIGIVEVERVIELI